jgi:hypothetical protein
LRNSIKTQNSFFKLRSEICKNIKPLKIRALKVGEPDLVDQAHNGKTTEGTLGRLKAQWHTMLGEELAAGS